MGHRDRAQGRGLREARRQLGIQPPVAASFRGSGAGSQLHEGVPTGGARGAGAPARLAPLLRGARSPPRLLGHGDRHRAVSAAGRRVKVLRPQPRARRGR